MMNVSKSSVKSAKLDPFGRERLSALTEELSRLAAEQAALDAEAERLIITAPRTAPSLIRCPI